MASSAPVRQGARWVSSAFRVRSLSVDAHRRHRPL